MRRCGWQVWAELRRLHDRLCVVHLDAYDDVEGARRHARIAQRARGRMTASMEREAAELKAAAAKESEVQS